MGSDTKDFIKLLFSVVFLFLCCLFTMLYTHKILGFAVQLFLRYCILSSTARVRLGSIVIAPLSCRIFVQDFFYQDENLSLRLMDGYVSFCFWDSWLEDPSWTVVKEFMFDDLKGARCRVKVKKEWVQGVIVDVLREERAVRVRLEGNGSEMAEDAPFVELDVGNRAAVAPFREVDGVNGDTLLSTDYVAPHGNHDESNDRDFSPWTQMGQEEPQFAVHQNVDSIFSSLGDRDVQCERGESNQDTGEVHDNDGVSTSLFNIDIVQIPQSRGKVRVHLNGLGLCLYNATWSYKELTSTQAPSAHASEELRATSAQGWTLRSILGRLMQEGDRNQSNEDEGMRIWTRGDSDGSQTYSDESLKSALEEQQRLKNKKSIVQRLFDFIGAVEVEMYASYIDIGGAGAAHPYFLHFGFKRGECHSYLTMDGMPSIDLYRFVTEMTLEEVHARWCHMKKEKEDRNALFQHGKANNLGKSLTMMGKGTSLNETQGPVIDEASSIIRNYGMLLNGRENSTIHIVFYRDVTNVYAGEEVSREVELPHMGLEVLLDVPEICYGPWSHYSLMELKNFFLPFTYKPLESLNFELGKSRPLAGLELLVEFLRDTCVTLPFKRKAPCPSPPFGIRDSGRKGVILMTLGRESHYIQKPQFLLSREKKQRSESFFSGKNVSMATNGIQEESTLLARMSTIELFIDREDDRVYTGRKLWNVLPSFGELEVWWYMDHVEFFMDLITDWQFVAEMYHGVPLTTEIYNTYSRFVTEFSPNVKRFELFFTAPAILHLNCNPRNVIFSEDLNDESLNSFMNFHINGTGHFFITLPNDTYFLSASTEVQRPFEMILRDFDVSLSLPPTHPLYRLVGTAEPFARVDEVSLRGLQNVYIPNQTVPQDKTPVDPATGRTKLLNHLHMDIQLTGLRGFLMSPHISSFLELIDNLFGDSQCVIRPEELFWPPSRIHPKLDLPKNVRQSFNDYLQKDEPRCAIQELSMTLNILDMDVTLRSGGENSPKLNLCGAKFNFSLIKQCASTDMTITATPITGRFFEQDGDSLVEGTFLCLGEIKISSIQHFGPMPMRTPFHRAMNIILDGITFEVTVEQMAMLTQLLNTLMRQFPLRDARLLREIETAKTRAAYSTDHIMPQSAHPRRKTIRILPTDDDILPFSCVRGDRCTRRKGSATLNKITDARLALERFIARDGPILKVPFSESIPELMAVDFNKYLEAFEAAADEAKDHAVVTILASLECVAGCVRVGPDGYLELQLPRGVQLASSTLNDLNSNSRVSAAVRDIALRGFCRLSAHEESKLSEDFVEVFHVETSLRMRNCTAYPFDQGLEHHLEKQRRFLDENDMDRLFNFWFSFSKDTPLETSTTKKPETGVIGTQPVHANGAGEEDADEEEEERLRGSARRATISFLDGLVSFREKFKSPSAANTLSACSTRSAEVNLQRDSPNDNNNNTSQRYATCLSATSEKDLEGDEVEEMECTGSDRTSILANDAFAAANASGDAAPTSSLMRDVELANDFMLRPLESFTSFLRPFFLHSRADDEVTSLNYNAAARQAKGGIRDFTCFHAPLPSTTFFASMSPHRAPKFCMAQAMLSLALGDDNDEESDVWALRQTDNRKRSREGATSKHLHVEAVAPITVLVTRPFLEKLSFEAEARFFTQVHYYQSLMAAPISRPSFSQGNLRAWGNNDLDDDGSQTGAQIQQQRVIPRKELSRNRVHQKRWLSEVKITSVILPCIEVKALTDLPVPREYAAPGDKANGVYATTLGVRSFQFVMQQTLPPAHAAMPVEKRAFSASVTLSSLAVITQIEYEPAVRNGNLQIKVPGIAYDEEKDTLAVAYLTSLCGRGKRDNHQGIGSGTCRLSVDTVALHLTRDFFFFAHSVHSMLQQLQNMRQAQQRENVPLTPVPFPILLPHKRTESFRDIVFPKQSPNMNVPFASLEHFGIEASITVQGVGNINLFRVELIDVYREGRYIHVNTELSNVIEVKRPSAKFIARVPLKWKGDGALSNMGMISSILPTASRMMGASLPSSELRSEPTLERGRRDVEVQLLGEIEELLVKCYPSALRIFAAAKKRTTVVSIVAESDIESPNRHFTRLRGRLPSLDMKAPGGSLGVVVKGSFTLRQLDAYFLHSELNYMQFKVVNLTGCGESRAERISSRECVQTHVFTEAISEWIRKRLHVLAQRARSRAPKSRCAAPPSVTPELHLRKTASFFAESILLQYVADAIVPPGTSRAAMRAPVESMQEHKESRVFVATAKELAVGMHNADQNHIPTNDGESKTASDKKPGATPEGVQMNLQIDVGKVYFLLPYRPLATETVQAQVHEWLQGWIEAKKLLKPMRHFNREKASDSCLSLTLPNQKKIHASCCAVQLHEVWVKVDLPHGIHAALRIPLASAFFNFSSDKRLNFKAHLHPFTLTSESPSAGRHAVKFPSVYAIYAKDELVRTGMCLLESVEITVSSTIISHLILILDRIADVYTAVSKPFYVGREEEGEKERVQQPVTNTSFAPSSGWEGRFVFLLGGLRVSYLTSMTNLRFSVRKLNALMEMSFLGRYRMSKLMVNVVNAQIALVDRDDYDQLQSTLRQATFATQSEVSAPSTMAAATPNRAASLTSEESARLVRPLGGFIWGLFETSFTLSSGRSDKNDVRAAIENIFAASRGIPVGLHELGKLGITATRWNLSIRSPLIIARVGLAPLLRRSFEETRDLAEKLRFESQREGRLLRRQLFKHAAYRRLTRVRKQVDAQVELTQRENIKRLQELTAQVLPQGTSAFHKRPSYASPSRIATEADEKEDFFNARSDNKFFATVSNFLVVVPFGDAAYRNIIEGDHDVFISGRGALALNRRRFIPTMALKLKVEKSTFACRLLKSQRWAPAIQPRGSTEGFGGFIDAAELDATSKLTFTARYVMDDAQIYFSDGSPLESDISAKYLLSCTHVLGGLGTLTSLSREECRNSFSKVFINSIDVPLHVNKSGSTVKVGAVMDMSAPQISISTRFVSILSQFTKEMPSASLSDIFKPRQVSKARHDGAATLPYSAPRRPSEDVTAEGGTSRKERHADPFTPHNVPNAANKSPNSYHFDVTMRVERGEVKVYSIQRDAAVGSPSVPQASDAATSKMGRSHRRRVRLNPEALEKNTASSGAADAATVVYPMAELLAFPTPDITTMVLANVCDSTSGDHELIVRVELRASAVEILPSIMSLAEEIEEWATVHDRGNSERVTKLLGLVKGWERDITSNDLALHSSIADVALPVPSAFAEAVAQSRATSSGVIALRRQKQNRGDNPNSLQLGFQHSSGAGFSGHDSRGKNTFTSIHIRITGLRFVLMTEPASTVTLSLFLDERGGSLDFFVQRFLGQPLGPFQEMDIFTPPPLLFTICARKMQLECQAKLEVKSFEMFLPEAVTCVALRRRKHVWELTNVYIHTPPDVSGGVDLEVRVRAPHLSQLFIVQELWHKALLESLQSIRQMFTRSASIIKENVQKSVVIRRGLEAMRKGQVEEVLVVVVTASHIKLRLDLSSGNAQQATLGGVSLILLRTRSPARVCYKTCFDLAVRSFILRSEGVLSGVANLESVLIKAFFIENADNTKNLMCSPTGRTFRELLCVQKLHAMFKERQLKDVFECQATEISLGCMDGVGEEERRTVEAELSLYRSSVFVTPSTVPAVLSTISNVGEVVSTQREVSVLRLRDGGIKTSHTSFKKKVKEVLFDIERLLERRKCLVGDERPLPLLGLDIPCGVENSNTSNSSLSFSLSISSKENGSTDKPSVASDEAEKSLIIPFMGNPLTRIPCGKLTMKLEQTTLLLGTASTGATSSGSLIASFPKARLSFAECPGDGNTTVKKVLEINTENVELFRPGAVKVVILGFRGTNNFEFYSRQGIGDAEVGFMLTLLQSNPWTGNPRFQDFQELIQLVCSFTAKDNAEVFHRFGRIDQECPGESSDTKSSCNAKSSGDATSAAAGAVSAPTAEETVQQNAEKRSRDDRYLKALRHVKFSPQLRFGGDVAVNVDVILNWLGVSEKMLPQILHMQACDRLEGLLNRLSKRTKIINK
ncbi:hypothetical protein ECC02_010070 [Trypanosoma cruzi]|uniref:Fragile site-associated protein C-terminal domain-containing protein n=1 Tax=Trypanosoma cruzi TaxID=5693 RepID=A0A7J6XRD3_TRYCR|nr:hypothetical protein ECC02_010070 [Trypanosoma cruzi]